MKIKSFTIMEITIALLLSTILIMMCYKFFSTISQEIAVQKGSSENRLQELQFRKYIEADFFNADGVYLSDSGFVCMYDTIEIQYELKDSFILRKYIQTDSFAFTPIEEEYWNDSLREYVRGNIINRISLKLMQADKEFVVRVEKKFGSDRYFK